MVTARRRPRRKSAAAIRRAERADQFAEPGPGGIAQTAEALQWSAKYCAELQVKIDAATRAPGEARP
jgi:hypothetical protein